LLRGQIVYERSELGVSGQPKNRPQPSTVWGSFAETGANTGISVSAEAKVSPEVSSIVVRNERGCSRRIGRAGVTLVEKMARDGATDTTIARTLRIARDTFRSIRQRQPEVEEALARGRAVLEDELTHILLAKARGGETVAAIYLTKARFGWREGETPPSSSVTNNTQVNIIIPPQMSDAEWQKMVAGA
jgi:hypothetical protein